MSQKQSNENWSIDLKKYEILDELIKLKSFFEEDELSKRAKLEELQESDILKNLIHKKSLEDYELELNTLKKKFDSATNYYIGGTSTEPSPEWLRLLYERYSERFLKDNDRIWTVTSIFIPLSLAGLSSVKDATLESTIILAIASIGLICFWYLICEKHRKFQEGHEKILDEIERKILFRGIKMPYKKSKENWFIRVMKFIRDAFLFRINIQNARRIMLAFVILLWASTILAVYCIQKKGEDKVQKQIIILNHNLHETL